MPKKKIKPSDVTKMIFDTVWENSEKETVATNILELARDQKGDEWKPFTWEDYVAYCSHEVDDDEEEVLDEFVSTGYLSKDTSGAYHFKQKILGVYRKYCD